MSDKQDLLARFGNKKAKPFKKECGKMKKEDIVDRVLRGEDPRDVIESYFTLSEQSAASLAKLAKKKSGTVVKQEKDEIVIDFETEKQADAFASIVDDEDSYEVTSKMVDGKHRLEIEIL